MWFGWGSVPEAGEIIGLPTNDLYAKIFVSAMLSIYSVKLQ